MTLFPDDAYTPLVAFVLVSKNASTVACLPKSKVHLKEN